jgi:hypothetical protein
MRLRGRDSEPLATSQRASGRASPQALPSSLDEARPEGERSLAGCQGRFSQLADQCGVS